MSVLTGMFSPTSGTASINGHDITEDMASVRRSLGLCPQHNMLFEDLNVREHLRFFGMVFSFHVFFSCVLLNYFSVLLCNHIVYKEVSHLDVWL